MKVLSCVIGIINVNVIITILLLSLIIESSKSAVLLNNALDKRNWISNCNDDVDPITMRNEYDHYVKDETVAVPGPTSSLPAKTRDTATLSHYNQWPLWLTNQRTTKRRQQVTAPAAPSAAAVAPSLLLPPSASTPSGIYSAAWPQHIAKLNNESLKLNKLKATDTDAGVDMNANDSRMAGRMQRGDHAIANDIEGNNCSEYHHKQRQRLQQPQTTNQQHKIQTFYTANALQPLAFGQLPQFSQLQQQQHQQQESSLPTPLPQVHHDNSHQHQTHQMADYRLLHNAESDTKFYLYTLAQPRGHVTTMHHISPLVKTSYQETLHTNTTNTTTTTNAFAQGRVLHVVTDAISAAFGVDTHPVAGIPGIRIEQLQLYDAGSLRQSRFNPFNPTRILIHGWLGGSFAIIYNTLVPAYLKLREGTYNIICVDWGKGAFADYITASYRVKPVGKVVAKFLDFLHQESGTDFDNIHVVGFSMGAHVAGIAGKHLQTGRLSVIYALDPAMPLFRYDNVDERISRTDADYVEVVHTSAGSYGYDRPLGHVDFYVNYGSNQPGCYLNECSHLRGFQIFAQSLANERLKGHECKQDMWQNMIRMKRCEQETDISLNMNVEGLSKAEILQRSGVYYVLTNT